MKTVFYVNCTDIGSTGKIIQDTADVAVKHGYRCVLCAPNIAEPNTPFLKKYRVSNRLFRAIAYRISKITGNQYGQGNIAADNIIRRILREKADLVHIHCANGSFLNIYKLLNWLKKHGVPTVVTNHAEFFYTGNCDLAYDCDRWETGCGHCPRRFSVIDTTEIWWKKMKCSFSDFPGLVVTSVSPWVHNRACLSPIMDGVDRRLVVNGVNDDTFRIYEQENVWQKYGIDTHEKRVVLYVTACFYGNRPEKGSEHLLRLAEKMADESLVFVVAGNHLPDVVVPDNVVLLGRIENQQELAQLYSAADLALITSRREAFSMPVAESLCCGTPIVGFQAGGPESIALQEYSEFVRFGDTEALAEAIREKWLHFKNPESAQKSRTAAQQRYGKTVMADQYIAIYDEITGASVYEQ